ncbi:hypothetical protein IC575_001780 [Cucumis melo]
MEKSWMQKNRTSSEYAYGVEMFIKNGLKHSKTSNVMCPRQLDSVGCGYYVQKYIHEIVHNSSTSITNLFNTKNAYRQEEIDEIRTEWAAFVSRFV